MESRCGIHPRTAACILLEMDGIGNWSEMDQEGLQELGCIIPHLCEHQEKLISEIMSPQLRVAIKVLCVIEDDAEAQNSSWGSQQNIVLATDLTWFGEASTACS